MRQETRDAYHASTRPMDLLKSDRSAVSPRRWRYAALYCVGLAIPQWLVAASGHAPPRDSDATMSLASRLECQSLIEDLRWSYSTWPESREKSKPVRTQVLPDNILQDRIERQLRFESALAGIHGIAIDRHKLQVELNRVAGSTKSPRRLQAYFDVLGNDADHIAECLLRPALVEKYLRDAYSRDASQHGPLKRRVQLAIDTAAGHVDLESSGAHIQETTIEPWAKDASAVEIAAGVPENALEENAANPRKISPTQFTAEYRRLRDTPQLRETETTFVYEWPVERTPDRIVVVTAIWQKESFGTWWKQEESRWNPAASQELAKGLSLPAISTRSDPGSGIDKASVDTWRAVFDYRPDPRSDHTAVWTGNEMIVWGGKHFDRLNSGGRYDPVTDMWRSTATADAPPPRYLHTAVWTGTEMVVWGGREEADVTTALNTGSRYDPTIDAWAPTNPAGAPTARYDHTAIWTGTEMIVWGGTGAGDSNPSLKTGGRYDPVADAWTATEDVIAPVARAGHTAVWTGEEMIVFGENYNNPANGAAYDPDSNSWREIDTTGAPAGRREHAAVWTGNEMIVWGGKVGLTNSNTGGRYDPATDTWVAVATANAPTRRDGAVVEWTGSNLLVWGGRPFNTPTHPGSVYDPATNTWTSMTAAGGPADRWGATGIWSGEELIVWGGTAGSNDYFQDGGRYNAATDSWMPVADNDTPLGRYAHTSVWTGNQMIVWGGRTGAVSTNFDDGGRYDPVFDRWWPLSPIGAPAARSEHTAVWTGTHMIVWGGLGNDLNVPVRRNTGGLYDPVSDEWQASSTVGAPVARRWHTTVWTGSEMVVWGGESSTGDSLITGGRYNPGNDTWLTTSTLAPGAREQHSAVWTGNRMLIWGGQSNDGQLDTGAVYNPQNNSWAAMNTAGGPISRTGHTALWTGSEMIVWGGFHFDPSPGSPDSGLIDTGGRYDPQGNTWTETSLGGVPAARDRHASVWTGQEMLIWGGRTNSGDVATGGRYSPGPDTWQAMTAVGAPSAHEHTTAAWTGEEMIVWGGVLTGNIGVYYPYDTPVDASLPEIAVDRSSIGAILQPDETASETVAVGNRGGLPLVWSTVESSDGCSSPGDVDWLSLSLAGATTEAREATDLTVNLDAPPTPGIYAANICINSNDPALPQVIIPVSIDVPSSWTLGPAALPVAIVGDPYFVEIHVVGDDAQSPVVFSIGDGVLPEGIQLDGDSGEISGIAEIAGTYEFSVLATDALDRTEERTYQLAVLQSVVFDDGFE